MKKVLKKVMALALAAVLTIGTAVTSTAAAPSPTTGKKPVNQIADTDSKGNNTKSPVYTVRTYDTGRARIIGAATIKKNVTVPNYVKVNGVKYRVTSIGAKSLKNWKSVKKITLSKNITVEVVVFPRDYEKYKEYLVLTGYVQRKQHKENDR